MSVPVAPVTAPDTQANLKSYFQNGVVPNEWAFNSFVDTMFFLYNETVSNAAAAETAAQTAPKINVRLQRLGGAWYANGDALPSHGITSVTETTAFTIHFARIAFTTPYVDAFYAFVTNWFGTNPLPGSIDIYQSGMIITPSIPVSNPVELQLPPIRSTIIGGFWTGFVNNMVISLVCF